MKKSVKIEILESHPELTQLAIDFYTCPFNNEGLFKDIKEVFDTIYSKPKDSHKKFWIMGGRFSINDFVTYGQVKKIVEGGFPLGIAETIVEGLLNASILLKLSPVMNHDGIERFHADFEYVKFLKNHGLVENLLYGFNYIIEKYRSSVFIIEITDKLGDKFIGTGFLISKNNKSILVTNKHVIENTQNVEVIFNDTHFLFSDILKSKISDIAFIVLKEKIEASAFYLNPDIELLSNIITIGYPSIPLTKKAYQVFHKGEVNSYVEDYCNNELFLISAKTSSGNSGSPVIDKYGSVVGIITEELFEKESFYKKGKLPYYAAIPSSKIISELDSFEL